VRVCIYCLEKQGESAFNAEHVIPRAFGQFEGNLVLDCVCTACNQHFGDTIDMKLARDSIEGIDRYWSGLKPASEFKSLGSRSTTTIKFKEGAIHSATGYPVANPRGEELGVLPAPQLGFEQGEGAVRWFRADDVPHRDKLPEHGVDLSKGFSVHSRGMSTEDAQKLLARKGFTKIAEFGILPRPAEETIETTMVGVIGRPETRAATKIALNYLAAVAGPALVRTAAFDEVRQFARWDAGASRVHVSENPLVIWRNGRERARGHYLAVKTMPGGLIVGQVSLMLRIRYVVHLMSGTLVTGTANVSSGHFFDIDTHAAKAIPVPELVPGRQLKPVGTSPR
jgi:hypothetical protein